MPGLAVEFDDAAMIADNLGDQGQTEAAARGLGGDERIEEMGLNVFGNAAAIIVNTNH